VKPRWILIGAITLALLTGGAIVAIRLFTQSTEVSSADKINSASQFNTLNIPLGELSLAGQLSADPSRTLSVNGQLKVNNSFVLSPTAKPQNGVAGQMYYDRETNQLNYYNGNGFVSLTNNPQTVTSIDGVSGSLTLAGGLSLNGNQLRSTGVVSITSASTNLTVNDDGSGNITLGEAAGASNVQTSGTGGTAGRIAVFSGTNQIADSLLSQTTTDVAINGGLAIAGTLNLNAGSTSTINLGSTTNSVVGQIYNDGNLHVTGGSNNLWLDAGGTGTIFLNAANSNRVAINESTIPAYPLEVNGDINITAGHAYRIGGTLICDISGCVGGGGGGGVSSLNGLSGALTVANASAAGSTVTINDASTAQKGIAQFNATNFTASGGTINTIQDINAAAAPTFGQLTLASSQASAAMLTVNNTNGAATGNLLDLKLNGTSKFAVSPAGALTLSGTVNGQTISSSANFTGTLTVASTATLNGNATVGGILTANTITPSSALTIGAAAQSFTLQGNASSTIAASNAGSTTTLAFQTPTANVTYRFLTSGAGTYDVCTTAGNCTGVGGGVSTPGGTANKLAKFTAGQTIGDSIITDNGSTVTIGGALSVNTVTPSAALTIGATGQNLTLQGATVQFTATAGGITNTLTFATASGSNKTITIPNATGTIAVSASGPLALDASGNLTCPSCVTSGGSVDSLNGLTGALTLANASGAGTTVTINDASTAQKGIAQFNSTNFSASGGVINTIQNIATTATPTFAGINTNAITPSGALTVGATTQNATLQGATTTITSTSGANTTGLTFVAPTANVTYRLQTATAGTYDVCTTAGNCTGVGGGVTTPGGTTNTLAKFTGSQAIGDSIITDNGSLVTIGGNLTVTGTTTFSTPLSVANGGTGTNTLATNGVIVGNGSGALTSVTAGGTNLCLTSTAGAPAFAACDLQAAYNKATGGTTPEVKLNSSKGALDIQDADTTIAANLFNVRSSNSGGLGQILFGIGSTGAITTQNTADSTGAFVVENAAGAAQLTVDTTNSKVVIGTLQTNTITPTGALTVGATGQSFTMQGNASSTITASDSGSTTSLVFQTPTANVTYRLLTAVAGTFDICTTVGNCSGTGGGVTTPGGTSGKIARFTGAQTIADSIITDNGSTVTIGGTLSVNTLTPTGALTVGATGQNLTLQGATVQLTSTAAGITNTLAFATPASSNKTITLPNISGTVCLDTGNCLGGGGGGANTSLSNLTAVAINTSLLPNAPTGINLGSGTLPFGDLYLSGTSGTPGTNNFKLTGVSTGGTRTITLPDGSGTVCLQSSANCNFAPTTGGSGYIQNGTSIQTANYAIQSASAGSIAALVRGAASQTASIFEVQNSSNSPLLSVGGNTNLITANDNLIINGQGTASDTVLTVKANASQGGADLLADFQQNGGTSVARVTYSGGLFLGNSGGLGGSINVASTSGSFAAINTATLSAGRTITIPNASGTICLDSGNCGTTTGTLQSAYGFSTGGTTPEIKLDSTRLGLDVQDADSTLGGSANFASYRASNGSGLGAIVFGWGIQGNYFQKPTADSVSLYQVQTSAGNNLFTIDSTNGRVGINLGGSSNPSYTLEVKGDLNVGTGVYRSGGTAGLTATTCSGGQVLQNLVVSGGIVTGGTCTANVSTLQQAYDASTNPEIVLNATNGALTIRDASTPLGANLLEVQDNGATVNYFAVTASRINTSVPLSIKTSTDSTTALNVKTSIDNNAFTVDTTNGRVGINLGGNNTPTLANGGLHILGSIRLTGVDAQSDTYTTPLGTGVNTRINIANFDPAAFGQVVAMGLNSTAASTTRVLSLFDARTTAHQPTISVFTPDEANVVGFSWEGSNTNAYLKTTAGNIVVRSNATDIMTMLSGGNVGIGVSPSYKLDVAGDVNTSTQYRIGGNVICTSSGCTPSAGSSSYIQNQNSSNQAADLRISGTARVNTAVNTPVLDTATGVGLAIGNTNATSISLGNTGSNLLTTIYGQGLVKSIAGSNSTTAFQIQSNTATVALNADTVNLRVGVGGNIAPGYPLDVTGDINSSTALRIAGTSVCDTTGTTGCTAKSGSGFYIHNQITLQSANMFIQASDTSAPTAAFEQGASGTADVVDVFKNDGTTKYLSVSSAGNFAVANGGTYSLDSTTSGSLTSSGAITVTAGGASTWSTSSGNLTLQAATTNSLNLQTGGAGTINVGVNNTTAINVGNSSNIARTISIGDTSAGSAAQTVTLGNAGGTSTTTIKGGTGSTAINLTPASGGSINLTTTGASANINTTASGSIINKVSTDSTTAYQIQNSASASLFTVDTSTSNISLLGNNSSTLTTWATTTAMSIGSSTTRVRAGSFSYNGFIYNVGGVDGTGTTITTTQYAKLNADGTVGTWTSTTALPGARKQIQPVVLNGYVYVIGGRDDSNTVQSTSYYAKLNPDGTIGAWNTTTPLTSGTVARFGQGTIAYNGYIYTMGGFNSSITALNSNYYIKANADGTLGSAWTSTTTFSTTLANINGATVANGYAYVVGGFDGSTSTDAVRRAKLNTDGTMGSWTNQTGIVPGGGDENWQEFVANGYLYVVGGDNGTRVSAFPLNADGSVGTAVSLTSFPVNMGEAGGAIANGYLYVLGGSSGTDGSGTVRNTVYYASTSRVKVGGNLDLVNYSGENLAEGGTGGALTAGNTSIVGTLQVQDSATFIRNVSIGDSLSVGGTTTVKPGASSVSAFQVQNTSGTNQLSVDTTNSRVYVGPTAGDTTGSILVLGNKTNAGDPTGVAGAMYYNSSTNTFRCYENGAWTDCLARHKIVLGSDVANTGSNCVSANITGLSFSVTSGSTYRWHAQIAYSADATTTGSEWTTSTPTTTLLTIGSHQYTAGGAGGAATEYDQLVNTSDAGACSTASAFTAGNQAMIDGVVTPSANGTVQMRFASEVSGGTITAKAGSTLEWW
jgi:hypothetical protein